MDVCQSHACTNPSPDQSYYNPNTQAKLSFVTLCLVTILSVSATKVEPKSLLWHMHISTLPPLTTMLAMCTWSYRATNFYALAPLEDKGHWLFLIIYM